MKSFLSPLPSQKSAGFTLLELLVVISIIGILIAMGTAAFSTAQQKSRDARRRSDVKAMQSAFEQYYSTVTGYDGDCSTMADGIMPAGLPDDPQSGDPYSCLADTDSYCVCASLENAGDGNATSVGSADACAYGTGDFYCLSSLQ